MTGPFTPVASGARLSDQVAQQLAKSISAGRLAAGAKLPPEARLVEQFQVSRTVLREAVSRLKSLGLVDSRQGSGVYVSASPPYAPLNFDARHSVHSVRNRELIRGVNGSHSARAIRGRSRRTEASGRNTRLASGGTPSSSVNAVLRCLRASPIS